MATVSIYLNFPGNAEEAFQVYKSIFRSEFDAPVTRMGDMSDAEGMPPLSADDQQKIMHISMPILGGVRIMATDMLESLGHKVQIGNNMTINLEPDSRAELDRLFAALSEGGSGINVPQDMPWGAYWATCLDRFGIRWMFNCRTI